LIPPPRRRDDSGAKTRKLILPASASTMHRRMLADPRGKLDDRRYG
jgi:hypothetical protein